MAYLGKQLVFSTFPVDKYTGNGVTTAYTLSVTPGSENACIVTVNGLEQNPGIDYTISGVTLTFTSAPPNLAVIVARHMSVQGLANVPAAASVITASLAASAKTTSGVASVIGEKVLTTTSPVFGLKNKIINGNFDVWQRGITTTTPTSATYTTADRWVPVYDGTIGTFTLTQQAFTLGQILVPGEPAYFLRWNHTVAGSASTTRTINQRVESVRTFAGQTCTLSFWAQADSARTVTPSLTQNFGITGSPSTSVTTIGAGCNLTTSWQKFSQTFTVPSISGKTLGTAVNSDYLQISFSLPLNVTMTIDIAQVQLEQGSVDTDFERPHIADTLARCRRYYEKSFLQGTAPVQAVGTQTGAAIWTQVAAASTNESGHYIGFRVTKRTVPTMTTYNPISANAQPRSLTVAVDCSAVAVGALSDGGCYVDFTTGAGTANGQANGVHWAADAEL